MSTYLRITHGTSKGRETYGYAIVTVHDESTGKRYSCNGGGYDMVGTSLGQWLADTHQDELRAIADKYGPSTEHRGQIADHYGMYRWETDGPVTLDGACGLESIQRIAREIGLELERTYVHTGPNRGNTTGWIVTEEGAVSSS